MTELSGGASRRLGAASTRGTAPSLARAVSACAIAMMPTHPGIGPAPVALGLVALSANPPGRMESVRQYARASATGAIACLARF